MKILVTGSAGFVGFHLSKCLLEKGYDVLGIDGLTDYYDVKLKLKRNQILLQTEKYQFKQLMLEDFSELSALCEAYEPDIIVHLAAQAGVRHSINNPRDYLESNIVGTFNIMEIAKLFEVKHLLMASTSSVYGANTEMPFLEVENVCTPLTFYAATKLANESMGHSYANIYNLPITMFRFFTVYGPWGRPDLALYKFVDSILSNRPIDVYNMGDMYRDFTYVDDLVRSIAELMNVIPSAEDIGKYDGDSLSHVAPYRVVNIGNGTKVRLTEFIDAIEEYLGIGAVRNLLPMQQGDVPATWADTQLLEQLIGMKPQTDIKTGIARFIDWYRSYKDI